MMWFLLLLFLAHVELVMLQVNRLILKNGDSPCEGHVEIFHEGVWGYAGDKYWSRNTEDVVCRSTHCGKVKSSGYDLRPLGSKVWLNEMKCNGNEKNLWDCENPGFGMSFSPKDTIRKIKCSDEIKISLDGFQCAGAVQFSTDGERRAGYFCADKWGPEEANLVCKTLGCGAVSILHSEWKVKDFTRKKMMVSCSGIENVQNLWQCVTSESTSCSKPASVICTGHERLQLKGNASNVCRGQLLIEQNESWAPVRNSSKQISSHEWCQQMYCGTSISHSEDADGIQLTCSDNVKVVLMNNNKPSRCYGQVHISVNYFNHPVCTSNWTNWKMSKNSEVVCRELNCGKVVSMTELGGQNGIMDNVNCSGSESSLWHCLAKRDGKPFSCPSGVSIVCADSIDVRLKDGHSKCAGRVEIQYNSQWYKVGTEGWTDTNSDIVCRELNCGKSRKSSSPEKFSHGSGSFLPKVVNCEENALRISECITDNLNSPDRQKKDAVMITCEEHKVVFLQGKGSCAGKVGIDHGSETYWLPGSNDTWNQESANAVCRQMHCGEVSNYSSISSGDLMKDVWDKSYICSSNNTSLFDCVQVSSDHNATIATVTCTGNITVKLTKGCWGRVEICAEGKCGGVLNDTWTDQKSVTLCQNLGCGNINLQIPSHSEKSMVIFNSLHTTKHTANLNQSNLVKTDKDDYGFNTPAYVVCSDSVKIKMNISRYKCSGNVLVYFEGHWLPVCKDALDNETQNAICEEMKCGQLVKVINYFGPKSLGTSVVTDIQYRSAENGNNKLTKFSISPDKQTCDLGGLRCSSWRKMELKFNSSCSGAVFVHSEGHRSPVSIEGWGEKEGKLLCQDLNCGNFKNISKQAVVAGSLWKGTFSCVDVTEPNNTWDCEKPTLPSQKHQVSIECQDDTEVTLSEKCGGEVRINNISLCDSQWNPAYSDIVCQEKDCSRAVFSSSKPAKPDLEYYHVNCEDYHDTIGQCSRFKGKCSGSLVSVYCTDRVKFNTTEKCGGQIEVNYQNKWEKVCTMYFPVTFQNQLCKHFGCGVVKHIRKLYPKKQVNLETTLNCNANGKDIKHCVKKQSCNDELPAEIYCTGYVKTNLGDNTSKGPIPTVPIILGVGFALVLLILIVIFLRVFIFKSKRSMNVPSGMFPQEEAEFESGSYEDVTSKANELEDFNHGMFRPQAEVITESEARSTSSFPYDDIDEGAESQPLTFQPPSAVASGGSRFHDGARDESGGKPGANGVTYEVDDPQESYDDIEASPEIAQTKADVHESLQATPESTAVTPPGLVQGDEDYLVPGQDG